MEATTPSTGLATHVVFLLHGLWGFDYHMHSLRDALLAEQDSRSASQEVQIVVHCCKSYQDWMTYDGVDVCADRAVEEIRERTSQLRSEGHRVSRFSILG